MPAVVLAVLFTVAHQVRKVGGVAGGPPAGTAVTAAAATVTATAANIHLDIILNKHTERQRTDSTSAKA